MDGRTDDFYALKMSVFNALVETVDLSRLAQMDIETGRDEPRIMRGVNPVNVADNAREKEICAIDGRGQRQLMVFAQE